MARLGLFDPELRSKALFDLSLVPEGWFDPDFLGAGIAPSPAPPPVQQGGGTYIYRFPPALIIPAVPRVYTHTGMVALGRLRVGGRVVFFRNLAIEEEEELLLLGLL